MRSGPALGRVGADAPRRDRPPAPDAAAPAPPVRAVSIPTGERSELVWAPLRDLWHAWRVTSRSELHVNAGYRWDAVEAGPVFVSGPDGRAVLAFGRSR